MGLVVKPLFGILLNALALYGLIYFVPEITYTGGLKFFVLGGIILGLLNFFVKPVLKLFSLPFIILTLGLFLIVINALILWFLSYIFDVIAFRDVALHFPNFSTYVIGAIVLGIINWVLNLID